MPSDGRSMLESYGKVDEVLVGKGGPRTELPIAAMLEDFWLSGRLRLTLRKGRQIGWSTIVCPRVVVTTALFGRFSQSRGSRGTIGLSSTRQKEADERLWNIERSFYDLGIKVKIRGDAIDVPGRPVIVQSFPATSDVARGANAWLWWEDEMPAWRDGDGANPARERDAAILPTGAGHENFRVYSGGTPLGSGDYHAKLVDRGSDAHQRVYSGPSWVWRPELTEARCHELQPDPILFEREFAARPQDDGISAFGRDDVAAIARHLHPNAMGTGAGALFIDSSSGRGDGWSFGIAEYVEEPSSEPIYLERDVFDAKGVRTMTAPVYDNATGKPIPNPKHGEPQRRLHIAELGAFEGQFGRTMPFAQVVARIAALARQCGVSIVYGDQYQSYSLASEFGRHGLQFVERPWTLPTKIEAVAVARRLLRERALVVDPGPQAEALQRELLDLEERFTPSGSITISAKRTSAGHADRASLLLLVARCESEGLIHGSPIEKRGGEVISHETTWA